MKPLISSQRVVELAFVDGEWCDPACIAPALVTTAVERYLRPVAGAELLAALAAGRYPELLDAYVAPALAWFVRLSLLPLAAVHTAPFGVVQPRTDRFVAATGRQTAAARRIVRTTARTLLRGLSRHLRIHAADYPEYDPSADVLTRCSIHGDLVAVD